MAEITRDHLLQELEELKDIVELPSIYLADYFRDLRNDVDKVITSKRVDLQSDSQKLAELSELWKEMIATINSFEQQCINRELDLSENMTRLNSIEEMITESESAANIEAIHDLIENEEINLMKQLFQNKTIIFFVIKGILEESETNLVDILEETERKLIYGKLIIINDMAIRKKALNIRYNFN